MNLGGWAVPPTIVPLELRKKVVFLDHFVFIAIGQRHSRSNVYCLSNNAISFSHMIRSVVNSHLTYNQILLGNSQRINRTKRMVNPSAQVKRPCGVPEMNDVV